MKVTSSKIIINIIWTYDKLYCKEDSYRFIWFFATQKDTLLILCKDFKISPVDVILNGEREGIVDNIVNIWNIQASGGHICSYQQRNVTWPEVFNSCGPEMFVSYSGKDKIMD